MDLECQHLDKYGALYSETAYEEILHSRAAAVASASTPTSTLAATTQPSAQGLKAEQEDPAIHALARTLKQDVLTVGDHMDSCGREVAPPLCPSLCHIRHKPRASVRPLVSQPRRVPPPPRPPTPPFAAPFATPNRLRLLVRPRRRACAPAAPSPLPRTRNAGRGACARAAWAAPAKLTRAHGGAGS